MPLSCYGTRLVGHVQWTAVARNFLNVIMLCHCLQEHGGSNQGVHDVTARSKALLTKLRLMAIDHLDMSQADAGEVLRARSRAFAVPASNVDIPSALVLKSSRADLCLLPPCTKKQQRHQDSAVKLALEAAAKIGQVGRRRPYVIISWIVVHEVPVCQLVLIACLSCSKIKPAMLPRCHALSYYGIVF